MYVLSQVLIVVSDILCILSMLNKRKKNIVFYLILSTIMFGLHYCCLHAWTGAAIAGVELIFLIVMFILESKNKVQYNSLLSILTIIATVKFSLLKNLNKKPRKIISSIHPTASIETIYNTVSKTV